MYWLKCVYWCSNSSHLIIFFIRLFKVWFWFWWSPAERGRSHLAKLRAVQDRWGSWRNLVCHEHAEWQQRRPVWFDEIELFLEEEWSRWDCSIHWAHLWDAHNPLVRRLLADQSKHDLRDVHKYHARAPRNAALLSQLFQHEAQVPLTSASWWERQWFCQVAEDPRDSIPSHSPRSITWQESQPETIQPWTERRQP